jgi:hypothetical protein
MFVYIGIVLVGFFYVWKKGVLEWGPAAVRSQAASGSRTNLRDVQSGAQVDFQRGGS